MERYGITENIAEVLANSKFFKENCDEKKCDSVDVKSAETVSAA